MASLVLATMSPACSDPLTGLAALPPAPVAAYRLAPGDEVRVTMPGLAAADATNATYVVNDKGQLSFPVLGDVQANGKTVPELQSNIAAVLAQRQLLKNPTVGVQPVHLRPIYVLGEVKTPGEYQYRVGMSVLAAISAAGGYTFRAKQRDVAITRLVDGQPQVGRASESDMIQPGDTVRIVEKWF